MINSINIWNYKEFKAPIPNPDDGGYLKHKNSTPLKPLTNDVFERKRQND